MSACVKHVKNEMQNDANLFDTINILKLRKSLFFK